MPEQIAQVQRAFSAYTIERLLGRGGMATVYRAHDKKHDRKVAIKILRAELAAVVGSKRFLHEIRITANLQHSHILGLLDSGIIGDDAGELAGRPYYVMPFIEGESLRQRLDREKQLPVPDSVRIAIEVASALDYAHRHGIIHRDIKPENILLHDGSAIVADFGIALAVSLSGGARLTHTGITLGTPSYMSPEQAMGERVISARSDIYSLAAVCYELLTGEPPFTGPTAQAIVARVMTDEPRPVTAHRRSVPPHVAAAISQALEKLPADRFATAHDFATALGNPAVTPNAPLPAHEGTPKVARTTPWLYGVAAIALLLGGVALWGWLRPAPPKQVLENTLVFDSTEAIVAGGSYTGRIALSSDGSRLAYIGGPRAQLLIRPRSQSHAVASPGSEAMHTPFFSPDGRYVGILLDFDLKVAPITGGAPSVITDSLVGVAGASWGRDGFIYADGAGFVSLVRVEAKPNSAPKWFTQLNKRTGEFDHAWPDVLPNGKGVVFSVGANKKGTDVRGATYSIAVAEIPSGRHEVLINDAKHARYAPCGHLLYVTTNGTLMVVPFDQNTMKVTGQPTAFADGLRLGPLGSADLAVSATGTLLYGTGGASPGNELVWVSRDGKAEAVDSLWTGVFQNPAISPDGTRLAVDVGSELWIKRLDYGAAIRLASEGSQNTLAAWTPDSRSVTFSSNATESYDLWTKKADGSTPQVRQLDVKENAFGALWSPNAKWLIYRTDVSADSGSGDIFGIQPGVDSTPVPLVATKFTEEAPAISPDGQWLAYSSDESGQFEIYVVPFPLTTAAKWVVSTRGGTEPRWANSGKELFYRDGAGNMMAVSVRTSPTFELGRSARLFNAAGFAARHFHPQFAVARDDRRFLMIRPRATAPDKLIVVENWLQELPSKRRR